MIEIQYFAGQYEAYINGTLIDYHKDLKILLTRLASYHSESLAGQLQGG